MITFGDIIHKPKVEIFKAAANNTFYQNCKARENGIKEAIETSFRTFNYHIRKLNDERNTLKKWQKERIKSCLTSLSEYMEYLLNELDEQKIEKYCELADEMGERFIPFVSDIILIMTNSFHAAIETDLHWICDLTMGDSIDISEGECDIIDFDKYLPSRIAHIRELSNELKDIDYVHVRLDSISEAIRCFEAKHIKAGNLLLLTTIEGLVRSLGSYLVDKQRLEIDPTDKRKYSSLDNFLRKIPWKVDLRVNEINYGLLTGRCSSYKSTHSEFAWANLTDRLGFLCRRFKENRNIILHGEETKYASSLNCFLNLSAMKEVLLTIKEYQTVYN